MSEFKRYRLVSSKPIPLLSAMLDAFCREAHLSLEGDLSQVDFQTIPGCTFDPTPLLKRNTLSPLVDFAVLPLEEATKPIIVQQILPRVGLQARVHHVQIERKGQLVFAAYDSFDPELVWVSTQVSEARLQKLVANGVIKSFLLLE